MYQQKRIRKTGFFIYSCGIIDYGIFLEYIHAYCIIIVNIDNCLVV